MWHRMSANAPEDAEEGSPPPREGESDPCLSLSQVFDVLQNERRRHVLKHLGETEVAEFDDLVDHVAAWGVGVEPGEADSTKRKAAYTSLYQSHLPKLADLEVVEYDHEAGRVARGHCFDEALACLETVERVRSNGNEEAAEDGEGKGKGGPFESIRSALGL